VGREQGKVMSKMMDPLPDFGRFLPDVLVRSLVVVLLAGLVAWTLRRSSAAARQRVWLTAVVCTLLLPAVCLAVPQWRIAVLPAGRSAAPAQSLPPTGALLRPHRPRSRNGAAKPRPVRYVSPRPILYVQPDVKMMAAARFHHGPHIMRMMSATGIGTPARSGWSNASLLWTILAAVWLAGAAAFLGRLVRDVARLQRLTQNGKLVRGGLLLQLLRDLDDGSPEVRLFVAEGAGRTSLPTSFGRFRPAIVLPADVDRWPAERVSLVLAHELARIRRGCWAAHLVGGVACALYWFNPLVWRACANLKLEGERACGDPALASADGVAERPAGAARHRSLRSRRILATGSIPPLDPDTRTEAASPVGARFGIASPAAGRLAAAAAICLLLPLGAIHPVRRSAPPTAAVLVAGIGPRRANPAPGTMKQRMIVSPSQRQRVAGLPQSASPSEGARTPAPVQRRARRPAGPVKPANKSHRGLGLAIRIVDTSGSGRKRAVNADCGKNRIRISSSAGSPGRVIEIEIGEGARHRRHHAGKRIRTIRIHRIDPGQAESGQKVPAFGLSGLQYLQIDLAG